MPNSKPGAANKGQKGGAPAKPGQQQGGPKK